MQHEGQHLVAPGRDQQLLALLLAGAFLHLLVVMRRITSSSVTLSDPAIATSSSVHGALRPRTDSFQAAKLLRGVSRSPSGPLSTGLAGSPA